MSDTLDTLRMVILGEMRHRIVRRKRDGTYWYVAEHRGDGPRRWLPMGVQNQSGQQRDAERLFDIKTK